MATAACSAMTFRQMTRKTSVDTEQVPVRCWRPFLRNQHRLDASARHWYPSPNIRGSCMRTQTIKKSLPERSTCYPSLIMGRTINTVYLRRQTANKLLHRSIMKYRALFHVQSKLLFLWKFILNGVERRVFSFSTIIAKVILGYIPGKGSAKIIALQPWRLKLKNIYNVVMQPLKKNLEEKFKEKN